MQILKLKHKTNLPFPFAIQWLTIEQLIITPTLQSLEGPDWTKNKESKQVNWLIPYLYLELPYLHTLYNKER